MDISTQGPRSSLKRKRKFTFVAVHLGAGEHPSKKKEKYRTICNEACSNALKILKEGGSAGDAVLEATKVLENCGVLNAGKGSNLTIDGTVECDAAFMDGDGYFGSVGAVPGVPNPSVMCKTIADIHRKEKLFSGGRIPPNFMAGSSAKQWAIKQNIPTCDDEAMISKSAKKTYEKYMTQLNSMSVDSDVNDTVGAIAIDCNGQVASTVSSGGNWLKLPGRIGHSPIFGCGCWSANPTPVSDNAIAVSASGSGEMLSRVRLPQECAGEALTEVNSTGLVGTVTSSINKHFLKNASLNVHVEPRYVGLIALMWDGSHGEFSWGHSSSNFVVAYSSSKMRSTQFKFSELGQHAVPGKSLQVEGILL